MSSAAAKAAVKPRCLIAYIFTHRFPRQTQIKVIYDDFVLRMKDRTFLKHKKVWKSRVLVDDHYKRMPKVAVAS